MNYIDIIVPIKNESENLTELIRRIHQALIKAKIKYQVILVDDHSTDLTKEIAQKLAKKYPVKYFLKKGQPGKAFSILEGAEHTRGDYVAMIDADLQYPPEALPEMVKKAQDYQVVVARRQNYQDSKLRRFISQGFELFFGKLLHGFDVDVQSGLKLFKKDILGHLEVGEIKPWAIDLPLLNTARELGYSIGEVNIKFDKRHNGESKVNLVKTSLEIGSSAIKLKFKEKQTYKIFPQQKDSMQGAGLVHKHQRLITHTTLSPKKSALQTFISWQQNLVAVILGLIIAGILLNPLLTAISIVAILSTIYFIDALFNLFLIVKSLHFPPEIKIEQNEIDKLEGEKLPVYSILCPLYREGHILPQFLEAIQNLDWPKDKLDVLLLLEEGDQQTIDAANSLSLPKFIRTVVVPESNPKTKPKACNFGLSLAKGEYLVIYDAEDRPDPDQLKKAYLGFQKVNQSVACLQAKLNYYNPHQNLLTRLFTAEYSLWFDVMLTGLQSINTTIPLGGTSNHFRTKTLLELEGWDPFNVTEDCDLGVRLFKEGYKTAIIDSETLEEANSHTWNWLRQRSRWIKGYMQTYLVHMRNPYQFIRDHGIHSFIFQLVIGTRISFMLINPILWLMTISYFAFYRYLGTTIESFYIPLVFYMAVFSLLVGNFMYIYNYMIGCAKKGQWNLIKFVYLIPVYWLMASVAAFIALYQLIVKPHYWEKTIHGLHLGELEKIVPILVAEEVGMEQDRNFIGSLKTRIPGLLSQRKLYFGASMLVLASMVGNFSNFLLNAFLGRTLNFIQYGEFSLFTSLLFMSSIPLGALSATITQKISYLFGKYSKTKAKGYLKNISLQLSIFATLLTVIWLALIPTLNKFFQIESSLFFIAFSPIWIIVIASVYYNGYLKGTLSFGKIAVISILEALSKLIFAILIITAGFPGLVFWAIPSSLFISLALSWFFCLTEHGEEINNTETRFNFKFYISSFLSGISNITFLGLDIVLVKHFLNPLEAGQYGLLSLSGKMIFFFGSLLTPFILPIVSKNTGANKESNTEFKFLFGLTILFTFFASFGLLVSGPTILPIFFGDKVLVILPLLTIYVLAIAFFTIAQPIIAYFQAKENHSFVAVSFIASVLQIILLSLFHTNLELVVKIMFLVSSTNLAFLGILFVVRRDLWILSNAFKDLRDLIISPLQNRYKELKGASDDSLRILIFNWRDIKHKWAGGAETYLHELAKKWVEEGNQVTIFCGNDGQSPRHEFTDGVQIVRRGGFYMVYFWAFLYYILRFRGIYDVVIDSENGIPFFTPLYVKKPKFLLIHHIHQEVFREHLILPMAILATFLETKLMPKVYQNQKVITVSQSSKDEILKFGENRFQSIDIIHPGIHPDNFLELPKTKYPSLLYLGRLQPYKNIEVIIKAFKRVIKKYPKTQLTIAGSGESLAGLRKLTKQLRLKRHVTFSGKVSEQEKLRLLAKSWIFLQPSMIEGWGITVIEANASGTPVIASNVKGLRDSVVDQKTGILVKPKSVEKFAVAIEHLISNSSLRRSLSKHALEWAQFYSWKISNQKFMEIIGMQLGGNLEYRVLRQKAFTRE